MAIALTVMLTAILGVVEISRLMWTVDAWTDGTRKGVRYAVVNPQDKQAVRDVVANAVNPLDPRSTRRLIIVGKSCRRCLVEYSFVPAFDLGIGPVTVTIVNSQLGFLCRLSVAA